MTAGMSARLKQKRRECRGIVVLLDPIIVLIHILFLSPAMPRRSKFAALVTIELPAYFRMWIAGIVSDLTGA